MLGQVLDGTMDGHRRLLAMLELAGRWHTGCQPAHDA